MGEVATVAGTLIVAQAVMGVGVLIGMALTRLGVLDR